MLLLIFCRRAPSSPLSSIDTLNLTFLNWFQVIATFVGVGIIFIPIGLVSLFASEHVICYGIL